MDSQLAITVHGNADVIRGFSVIYQSPQKQNTIIIFDLDNFSNAINYIISLTKQETPTEQRIDVDACMMILRGLKEHINAYW